MKEYAVKNDKGESFDIIVNFDILSLGIDNDYAFTLKYCIDYVEIGLDNFIENISQEDIDKIAIDFYKYFKKSIDNE